LFKNRNSIWRERKNYHPRDRQSGAGGGGGYLSDFRRKNICRYVIDVKDGGICEKIISRAEPTL